MVVVEKIAGRPWAERHPSVAHFEPLFEFGHLPPANQEISVIFFNTAVRFLNAVPDDNPEVSASLRKLLEAKDCAVRAQILALKK